ncbi:MAG: acetyl-CoA carboxylase biotin carboxylase subunit, partial [Candidatus Marinimicrobia bacterium]|nr:acetyl-CoA carboxylase biotin carboxylase subunit [Candidatus Neomarinimicrobiota bacterium]
EECISKMKSALSECVIEGIRTILPYQLQILNHDDFKDGNFDTGFLKKFNYNQGD